MSQPITREEEEGEGGVIGEEGVVTRTCLYLWRASKSSGPFLFLLSQRLLMGSGCRSFHTYRSWMTGCVGGWVGGWVGVWVGGLGGMWENEWE